MEYLVIKEDIREYDSFTGRLNIMRKGSYEIEECGRCYIERYIEGVHRTSSLTSFSAAPFAAFYSDQCEIIEVKTDKEIIVEQAKEIVAQKKLIDSCPHSPRLTIFKCPYKAVWLPNINLIADKVTARRKQQYLYSLPTIKP